MKLSCSETVESMLAKLTDLGPPLEWKKMDTQAGPICYVCYNEAASNSDRKAQRH